MKFKPAYLIAFVVIALCMGVTLYSFGNSMANHVNIARVRQLPGETLQVDGNIIKDSINYDAIHGSLKFDIVDVNDPSQRLSVVYPEPKPESFDAATSVNATGTYKNGAFVADRLLTKCPSKYSDQKIEAPKPDQKGRPV